MSAIAPISQQIWDMKYRLKSADGTIADQRIEDTWRRVAAALAKAEAEPEKWEACFYDALEGFQFLPAGRIIAGAGTSRRVTLFNCFVMGTVPDDMSGIFEHLREAALTMQQGGGIGYDFSTLRPKGALVKGVGADASGPLTFMDVWDSMCRTIMSAGHRRGAMMATLRADHPDIEDFIAAKQQAGRLRMFNLSVLASDAFMQAVKADDSWELTFAGVTYKTIRARDLWDQIMRSTYNTAEPGVIFIDRINRMNNLAYCEKIAATNPCGEQPLPPYGACLLGSINLARLVNDPFEENAGLDMDRLEDLVAVAVRMLDNVVDLSGFPLPQQAAEATAKRRIGLGVTGLADALIFCRQRYGSEAAVASVERWLKSIRDAAYRASIELAKEKGAFPLFDAEAYLKSESLQDLPEDVKDGIRNHGIRNALLTSIAPTGTISLFADNVSSGIEPVFSFIYSRHVLMPNGERREEQVSDYAYRLFRNRYGELTPLPDYFADAQRLSPADHVRMQAAAQRFTDSSISKTINCPADISFDAFKTVYMDAYESGCKGCTTYRPNDVTGAVLEAGTAKQAGGENEPELPFPPPETTKPADAYDAGGVVHMTQPLMRPDVLPGSTYKLNWPESEHAIYITMNDVIEDGQRRPFEIFINSKNMDHFAWTVGLTRMISAVFRRGGNVAFVVEELKAVFDPRGGYWVQGRYIPSLLAAIGDVVERHMIAIGFIQDPNKPEPDRHRSLPPANKTNSNVIGIEQYQGDQSAAAPSTPNALRKSCQRCGQPGLIRQENCDTCLSCGYSKCG